MNSAISKLALIKCKLLWVNIGTNDVIKIIKSIILELSLLDFALFFLNKIVINNIKIVDIKIYIKLS